MAKVKELQVQDVSPELKAFIYQQISEFEPFFLPDSNVGVMVSQEKDQGVYWVKMVLTGGGTFVEAIGQANDVFEATANAKKDLLDHLYDVQNQMLSSQLRDQQIESLVRGSWYLH